MIYLICYLLLSAIVFISTLYFDAHYRHLTYDKVSETIKFDGFEGRWPINTMSLSYCKILEILGLLENI